MAVPGCVLEAVVTCVLVGLSLKGLDSCCLEVVSIVSLACAPAAICCSISAVICVGVTLPGVW